MNHRSNLKNAKPCWRKEKNVKPGNNSKIIVQKKKKVRLPFSYQISIAFVTKVKINCLRDNEVIGLKGTKHVRLEK